MLLISFREMLVQRLGVGSLLGRERFTVDKVQKNWLQDRTNNWQKSPCADFFQRGHRSLNSCSFPQMYLDPPVVINGRHLRVCKDKQVQEKEGAGNRGNVQAKCRHSLRITFSACFSNGAKWIGFAFNLVQDFIHIASYLEYTL